MQIKEVKSQNETKPKIMPLAILPSGVFAANFYDKINPKHLSMPEIYCIMIAVQQFSGLYGS